ncbi:MAG: histidine phosphatase family protein [Solirubrobacterales bacterium]
MAVVRLIRHGQASFGLKDYDKLSDIGVRQSQVLGDSLKGRVGDVDLVVCGGMRRHIETAEACLGAMGLDIEVQIDERWNEYDHHEVIVRHKPAYRSRTVMAADLARRGDPRHHFQLMFDEALARWTGGENDVDYAEPWEAFVDRANAGLAALMDETARAGNVLVFTSGGPTSAVAARLLGLDVGGWLKLNRVCANASETKIVGGRSGISLVTYNGHAHFDDKRDLLTYR